MRNHVFGLIRQLLRLPRIASIARSLKLGPAVLFYHGVEEEIFDPEVQTLHMPMRRFAQQIDYLRKHFEIVSLDYLFDCMSQSRPMNPRQLAITFDDGYKNNLEIVAPFLNSYKVPFSVFVSTNHISEGVRFPTYYLRTGILYCQAPRIRILGEDYDISTRERKRQVISEVSRKMKSAHQDSVTRIVADLIGLLPRDQWIELNDRFSSDQPMNWHEVRELSSRGATIGSHCHDHMLLHDKQSIETVTHQLQISKELVEKHIGECKFIAYPNGLGNDISLGAVEKVKECGYLAGFMTIPGEIHSDTNRYVIPRISAESASIHRFNFSIDASFRFNKKYNEWCHERGFA